MLTGTVKSDPLWPKTSIVFGMLGTILSVVLLWHVFVSHPVKNLTPSDLQAVSGTILQVVSGAPEQGGNDQRPLKLHLNGVPSLFRGSRLSYPGAYDQEGLNHIKAGAEVEIGISSLPQEGIPKNGQPWPERCDIASLKVNGQTMLALADYNDRMVGNAKVSKVVLPFFLGVSLFLLMRGGWTLYPGAKFHYASNLPSPPRNDGAF